MTTLAIMKARIATEIRRSNLTSDIAAAITTAIEAYQEKRFFFNEVRFTFATVANQEFYTSSDDADIGTLTKIDYVKLLYGNFPYGLKPLTPERIEWLSQNGTQVGQPREFCFYAQAFRLYPIPDQAYTVRVGAEKAVAAPAADGEADNPWMTYAERLIRSRAKWELAMHRTFDEKMATRMSAAIDDALSQLETRTNKLAQQGGWEVYPTSF